MELSTHKLKGERKKFSKTEITQVFDKISNYTKTILLKNSFSMFLANFIFVNSRLKVCPKYFGRSDVILVRKIILLKVYSISLFWTYFATRVEKR